MCGIAGILGLSSASAPSEHDLRAMSDAMIHRGPDDAGMIVRGPMGFAFRRLCIIDLSEAAHQPMCIDQESKWIVFNGEAYDFNDLRRELEHEGVSFRSRSDTEVVLQAYHRYGPTFLEKVRGMFALGIWDETEKTLLLARDRIGKKPLHYFCDGQRFAFASEIKSLLKLPFVSRDLDWAALEEYFAYGYVCAPRTIYAAIRKVRPGHLLQIRNGSIKEEAYWRLTPDAAVGIMDLHEAKAELKKILGDAVRKRMISDVPLGAFLSGGVDSSLIVALMAEASHSPVKTFSIAFGETKFDESAYARIASERFSTDHTEIVVKPDFTNLMPALVQDFDEPFGDSSALPTYVVARETRKAVTVALSGDGGDEAFGGYDLYDDILSLDRRQGFASALRPIARAAGSAVPPTIRGGRRLREWGIADPREVFVQRSTIFDQAARNPLFLPMVLSRFGLERPEESKRALFRRASGLNAILQLQYNDYYHYLPDDILVKVDRMSMLTSLEVRSPLLDHRIVEFAFGLSPSLLSSGGNRKPLLKALLSDYFPPEFVNRRKQGFAIPKNEWLRKDLTDLFRGTVLTDSFSRLGIFRMPFIRRLFKIHLEGGRDLSNPLWLLLCFGLWAEGARVGRQT